MDINKVLKSSEYDFLKTDPRINGHIMFLTFGGSYAYGTNNDDSDIDIRGCVATPVNTLLGTGSFEQFINTDTDTTIYSFSKLVKLLCSCNPNTIELLGCKPDTYTQVSETGRMLLDNRKLFLSKRAISSFAGYANAQLRRLENALVRDGNFDPELVADHILNSVKFSRRGINNKKAEAIANMMNLHTQLVTDEESGEQYYDFQFDANLLNCSIKDMYSVLSTYMNTIKAYKANGHRNKKKDYKHLCKHMMHLVRLYLTAFDILEKEEIITYREADLPLLLDVRHGKYLTEDLQLTDGFRDLMHDLEERLKYDCENTSLPDYPDDKKVNDLMVEINRRNLLND